MEGPACLATMICLMAQHLPSRGCTQADLDSYGPWAAKEGTGGLEAARRGVPWCPRMMGCSMRLLWRRAHLLRGSCG